MTKKKKSPNLLKNKNHVPKKITSSLKTKQNKTTITPTVQEIQKKEEKKKEGNIEGRKKKNKKKRKRQRAQENTKKKKKIRNSFLSIWRRKLFGGLKDKTSRLHHLFFFLRTPPNTLQKSFSFHFFLQNFLSTLFHLQTNTS